MSHGTHQSFQAVGAALPTFRNISPDAGVASASAVIVDAHSQTGRRAAALPNTPQPVGGQAQASGQPSRGPMGGGMRVLHTYHPLRLETLSALLLLREVCRETLLKCDRKKITVDSVRSTGIGFRGTRTVIRATN